MNTPARIVACVNACEGIENPAGIPAAIEAADILCTNAIAIPDPRMNGAADCYAISIDDFDALFDALAAIAKAKGGA